MSTIPFMPDSVLAGLRAQVESLRQAEASTVGDLGRAQEAMLKHQVLLAAIADKRNEIERAIKILEAAEKNG